MHRFSFAAILLFLLATSACNSPTDQNGVSSVHTATVPPDSAKPTPDDTATHNTHTDVNLNANLPFEDVVEGWVQGIFPDYKKVEMNPMDAVPQYKTAQKTLFYRIRRKEPISNAYGKAVYPRILVKAYHFAHKEALVKEVETWLNAQEGDTDNITLGSPVKNFKSPPLLCAVVGNDFWMVQFGCVYASKEWTATEELFFAKMTAVNAEYAWKVGCEAGEFSYKTGSGK
jgi:hypothetical protein